MASTSLALTNICRTSIIPASTLGVQAVLNGSAIQMLVATRPNPLQHKVSTSLRRFLFFKSAFQPTKPTKPTRPLGTRFTLSHSPTPPAFTTPFAARTFYSRTRSPRCSYTADKAAAAETALHDARNQLNQYLRDMQSLTYANYIESAYSPFATGESVVKNIARLKEDDAWRAKHEKDLARLAQKEQYADRRVWITFLAYIVIYVSVICYVRRERPEDGKMEKLDGDHEKKVHS